MMNPYATVTIPDASDPVELALYPVKLLQIYPKPGGHRYHKYEKLAPDVIAARFFKRIKNPIRNVYINQNKWPYVYDVYKFMSDHDLFSQFDNLAFSISLAESYLNFAEEKSRTLIFDDVITEQQFRFLNLNTIRYSMLSAAEYNTIPNWWNLDISEKRNIIRRSILHRMGILRRRDRKQKEEEEEESSEEEEDYPDDDDDEMESSSSSSTTRTRNPKRKTIGARIRFAGQMYSASHLRNEITKLEHISTFIDWKLNKLRATQAKLN